VIDVTGQINAVRRQVGKRVLEAGEARTSIISQTYDTSLDDLWHACTSLERISRWFLPISGELRLGGHYQFEGNAGGTVERCDPPHSFAVTWEHAGAVSWVEVRLSAESDDRSRFELEHIAYVDDKIWTEFGPGAVGVGWDSGLLGLALHLSPTAEAMDPQKGAVWAVSDEGKQFMTLSSQRWCEANIAAGEDEAVARAAADRTTAAYTATPEPAPEG
jgi:uncharacterized protein YndB with AHSA1/START domain